MIAALVTHSGFANPPAAAPRPSEKRGLSPRQLESVTQYIQTHLDQDTTLKTIASQASLSPFHFSRLFKQTTGLSPHRYVLQCRVERARELLLSTHHSAARISAMVGFCDQSHLVHHFKRHFGVTPKQLRMQRPPQD